jgi:hypothetical protein
MQRFMNVMKDSTCVSIAVSIPMAPTTVHAMLVMSCLEMDLAAPVCSSSV